METDSAGLDQTAAVALSPEQIEWADIIFVMEKSHRSKLSKKFKKFLHKKRVICLNIPDDFEFMQPELISVLEARVGPHLR